MLIQNNTFKKEKEPFFEENFNFFVETMRGKFENPKKMTWNVDWKIAQSKLGINPRADMFNFLGIYNSEYMLELEYLRNLFYTYLLKFSTAENHNFEFST